MGVRSLQARRGTATIRLLSETSDHVSDAAGAILLSWGRAYPPLPAFLFLYTLLPFFSFSVPAADAFKRCLLGFSVFLLFPLLRCLHSGIYIALFSSQHSHGVFVFESKDKEGFIAFHFLRFIEAVDCLSSLLQSFVSMVLCASVRHGVMIFSILVRSIEKKDAVDFFL